MASPSENKSKTFRSVFTVNHGAPAWVIEEVKPNQVNDTETKKTKEEALQDAKFQEKLNQLTISDQPGLSILWDDTESSKGWKCYLPEDDELKSLPDKFTVTVDPDEEEDDDFTVMPPIKYYDINGLPVYFFSDPVTGHKYWDECDCDACYEDCLLNNDGMTPQQLKEQYAFENPPNREEEAEEANSTAEPAPPSPPAP